MCSAAEENSPCERTESSPEFGVSAPWERPQSQDLSVYRFASLLGPSEIKEGCVVALVLLF